MPKLLTTGEAARELGVPTWQVARLFERGRGDLVRTDARGRQMPGAPVQVSVGQGACKRRVRLAAFGG